MLTGASGFIGSHLLPALIKSGHEVITVSRNADSLSDFKHQCRIVEFDIYSQEQAFFKSHGNVDVLLHLAWGGLPNYRSLHHIEAELPAHYRFIKNMVHAGTKNIAIAGTCFEYGMRSGQLSEKDSTYPENPYGYAKDSLRKQLEFLKNEIDFSFVWMRIFYMYGENQSSDSLYGQLRDAVNNGAAAFNMSGGEQIRDYMHVNDVIRGILSIALQAKDIGIVNICSGKPISIRCLVERWMQENHWDIPLNLGYYPYPDYEPLAFWGDNTKFNHLVD